MKRFMRGGKEGNASREQGGGCIGVTSPQPTPEHAKKDSPILATTAAATHATLTPAVTPSNELAVKQAATAKLAAAVKQVAAVKQAAAKATANVAAAKQTAANVAAAKLTAAIANEEITRQEEANQDGRAEIVNEDDRAQVEDVENLADPKITGKKELIPNVFWFSLPIVAAGVSDSFKAQYNFPYMNWTEVPESVRDRWFLQFKLKFTWKPEYEDMVRRDYDKKALERLKDLVNKASKVPLHKPIKWMSETVRRDFNRKREDPDFKKRSLKVKKNRISSQTETVFDPGHRQGIISTTEVAERLAADKDGVLPLAADVYEKTHGLEMPGGEKMVIGDRSKKIMAEYKEKLVEYNDKGVKKTPNEVYFEVAGGQKKGKVYGLGNASSLFYEAGSSSQSKKSTHDVSIISKLSSQLEECKKLMEEGKKAAEESNKVAQNALKIAQATQQQYEKEKCEWKKEKKELKDNLEKVKKVANEVFQLILKERSFKPHNPSKGGGVP